MRPTDHVQMVTSWCELTLRCVDWFGICEMPGKTVRQSRYFYIAITATSDRERGDDKLLTDIAIDCAATHLLSTLGSVAIFGFLQLRQTVADCCKVWHFSHYISLAIWIHSELLSLVSVAPRSYECSYTYSYKVSMKSLVVQALSIPFCYTHTIYDLTIIVLVLEQGYLCVTCCFPLIFFCCPYITRVVVYNHSPEVSYAYIVRDKYDSWSVDEIGASMKSIPRHGNQHTAAMWWTVNHVASNQQSVKSRSSRGWMVVYIGLQLLFLFSLWCSFVSNSAHQHWYFCTSCLYDYCSVCFPSHLL